MAGWRDGYSKICSTGRFVGTDIQHELGRGPHTLIYNECRGRRKYRGGWYRQHRQRWQRNRILNHAAISDSIHVGTDGISKRRKDYERNLGGCIRIPSG